jgi:hypothetical protein
VNATELKCYDYLSAWYQKRPDFNSVRHVFTVDDKKYIARTLQTDRITFTRGEVDYLLKEKIFVIVFSITDKPVDTFAFNDIDFLKHKTPSLSGIKAYITGIEQARGVTLTTSQYEELSIVKELIENDFGKSYSFGDIIHMLCTGYNVGRAVIMRESQPVIVNQPPQDEQTEHQSDQNA